MSVQVSSPSLCTPASASVVDMSTDLTPSFPLHPSVRDRLHPQYVRFYNTYLVRAQQSHLLPLAESRKTNVVFGGSPLLPVGHTTDIDILRQETPGPNVRLRCFVPPGKPPNAGWPVVLYVHGGGWVLGNIDSENHICTNMCIRSECVVVTPEYRLAPESPFPAAIHDCWETLLWIAGTGVSLFQLNASKIAVAGCSSGANLAAAVVNKSLQYHPRLRIVSQLLIVPVLDNTADPCNNVTWKQNEFTAALPAVKMLWYREHYLPNPQDRLLADASPLLFLIDGVSRGSGSLVSTIPPTLIIIGGVDILRREGETYGELLRQCNVPTTVHVMEGMPHPFVALDNVLDDGKKAINLLCDELNRVFSGI